MLLKLRLINLAFLSDWFSFKSQILTQKLLVQSWQKMAADQHREPGKIGGWKHEFHSAYSRIMQPILRQPLPMKGYKPQALLWILLLTTHPCYGGMGI